MAEVDYQMALMLQHTFNQEAEQPPFNRADHELARRLQEQFVHEDQVANPANLVYKRPKQDTSRCLADPSWEIIDPTPDIHHLFVAFNERFFWNKLLSVCVDWSAKMTTCAGVCSYQGPGGLCRITLSEPLLKLRPRKDLVETLLHEMIHAFLFVTNNNRDRDGHGPEFRKHMARINKEAGTNITVYHDFHDEVNLYKQHWWRCNGPCQSRKPYFGMVRRAMNRKPGPNDRWWADHQQNCGGTFIKVKEPQKVDKPKQAQTNPKNDIRTYFGNAASTVTSNAVGFGNLNRPSTSGLEANSNGTIVITKWPIVRNNATDGKIDYSAVRDHWLNKYPTKASWEEEEPKAKIPKIESLVCCPVCLEKICESDLNDHLDVCLATDKMGECFICGNKFPKKDLDCHLRRCAELNFSGEMKDENCSNCDKKNYVTDKNEKNDKEDKVSCLSCGETVLRYELNSHLDDCLNDGVFSQNKSNREEENNADKEYNCPFCFKLFRQREMKTHLDNCLDVARLLD